MRIAIVICSLSGGGAERVACNLANFLTKSNDVTIVIVSETEDKYELDERVTTYPLIQKNEKKGKIRNIIKRIHNLKRFIATNQTDAYVVMLPKTILLLLGLRKKIHVPIIASERVDPVCYPRWKQLLLKRFSPKADRFIFQTKEIRDWYGKCVKDERALIIPNAVNPDFIRPEYHGDKEKIICGVGRLSDQKNFDLLIDAFAIVHSRHKDYSLVIYGEGPKRAELETKINTLKLDDCIFLPGSVNRIYEKLEKSTAFVLSSDFEGMPNALMEAMALGLPCVSTDCGGGGARFLIDDGVNGSIVPMRDKDKMAEAMCRIIEDDDYRMHIGKNASKIKEKLAPDVIYGQWEKCIYDCTIKN